MGVADQGEHRHVGPGDFRQNAHLPEAGYAHLHHCRLMLRADAGDGHGHADLVIQILIRFQHVQPLGQYGGDHLLGRGLANAAGNADHRQAQIPAVFGADLLQGRLYVRHKEYGPCLPLRHALGQAAYRPSVEGSGDIVVSVHPLALIGHKKVAR